MMSTENNLSKMADFVLDFVENLPNPPRESIKKEWQEIKEFVMESRPPKIMIIGRRGAGKSSLINAIFGNKVAAIGSVMSKTGMPIWHKYEDKRGTLRILDTRGLGDKSKPESANFQNAFDEIKAAVKSDCPDVILFLCKAKEVDSRISEDVQNAIKIRKVIVKDHKYEIPVVSVVTQVDELDPKRVEPPYENQYKKRNIKTSVNAIYSVFSEEQIELLKIIPVSAYAEYENDKRVYDNYWNIESLVEYLIEVLPKSAQLELARVSKLVKAQKKAARKLIASTATISAGLAATPIPVGDILPITTAQIAMIIGIGYIAGRELSKKTAVEFMTATGINVGAGFALREAARALFKIFTPGAGNLISAGIAAAGTWGIGETAIAYFIENKSMEEAKKRGDNARKKHTND